MSAEVPPILDSQVYRDNGAWHRKTWYKGEYLDRGVVEEGPEGTQTVEDRVIIKPISIFDVVDNGTATKTPETRDAA